jgi:hypothetical protein
MKEVSYEQKLDEDSEWALREGGAHFSNNNSVHKTLDKIARQLDDLGVDYAVAGAMALFFHGYRRFTEDVDIIVTANGLKEIHETLEGLGYRPLFEGSRGLRDVETGVRIEFLLAGEFPGDGKPKAVKFPIPEEVKVDIGGKKFVNFVKLIELKLASGSVTHRLKDLADVQEAIKVLKLPRKLGDKLDASVAGVYRELWEGVQKGVDPPA